MYLTIENISAFLNQIVLWAKSQPNILGIALVGSYARNQARADSDIDLVIVTSYPQNYLSNHEWVNLFGNIKNLKVQNYGALTSIHVHYKDSHEVEFGITTPAWTDTTPIDEGTKEVVTDGINILYDPNGLFNNLMLAIQSAKSSPK